MYLHFLFIHYLICSPFYLSLCVFFLVSCQQQKLYKDIDWSKFKDEDEDEEEEEEEEEEDE